MSEKSQISLGANFGCCYWVTGLSGAGKTTVCNALAKKIWENGDQVILLDGDVIRGVLQSEAYSREERLKLGYTYSRLCKMLVDQGFTVVIGVIGLFNELHKWNAKNIPNYVEVFLDVPLVELENRDRKDIYKRARAGDLRNVAGIDLAVEFPVAPRFHFKWSCEITPDYIASAVFEHYQSLNRC